MGRQTQPRATDEATKRLRAQKVKQRGPLRSLARCFQSESLHDLDDEV